MQKYNNTPYGNYKMLSKDGIFLCYTDKRRRDWYVSRDLATTPETFVYQLTFESKGYGNSSRGDFYKVKMKNRCVVCGTKKELTKHHIVPHQFRKYLPPKYKDRNSYDIVIICNNHHNEYELEADKLKYELYNEYNLRDEYKLRIKIIKAYSALIKHRDKMPEERITFLTNFLVEHLDDTIENILNYDFEVFVDYKSIGEQLVEQIEDIEEFIVMWREHFMDTMDPQFIDKEWVDEINCFF